MKTKKTKAKRIVNNVRKQLIKDLDAIVSKIVIKRDKQCVICNKKYMLTNGHIITRVHYNIRWDLDNCYCQCSGCNKLHEYQPHIYYLWFINNKGLSALQSLYNKTLVKHKYTDTELQQLLTKLTNYYTLVFTNDSIPDNNI